jgi:hypothetical protein
MLVQPILEFKGMRIELNVEEAMKIAEGKANGAERVQAEIAMIVGVHSKHLPAPDGIEATPLLRAPLTPALPEPKPTRSVREPGPMLKCDWCGKEFRYQGWLNQHKERWCPKRLAEMPA